jgi:hypothetical protein
LTAIEATFDRDCLFSHPRGRHVGHRELEAPVIALHARFPTHASPQIGSVDGLQDSARLAWEFGPPHQPRLITGRDVAAVNGGRIPVLFTFLGPTDA